MSIKKYLYIIIAIAIVVFAIHYVSLVNENEKLSKENDVKTENINILNSTLKVFKIGDSINCSKISSLTYSKAEYERYRGEDMETIKQLKLKLKNVNSVTNIETTTIDTIIQKLYVKNDSVKCFKYQTEFIELDGCVNDSNVNLNYKTNEKLKVIVNTRYKHNFLFWHWGFKIEDMVVLSKNPKTIVNKIDYVIVNK